jgi:hypothetical protein
MVTIIGRQIELGLAKETARGTAKTTADRWLRKVTANIIPRAEKVVDDTTRARFEDGEGARYVRSWYEGDLEGIAHADALGLLFLNIYGTDTPAVATGVAYNHTFTVAQSPQHNSLTIFAKDGSVVQEVIANSMVSKLTLTASTDDFVRFNASFIGGVGTSNASSPSYGTEYDFISRDITVKIADTSGGIAGASAIPVKSMEVTWDQGLTPSYVFGSYTPTDIYNTRLAISGKLVLDLSDTTYRALLQADTAKYMSIVIQGAATIGSSSNPKINLVLNKAQIMDWTREGSPNDLVSQEVSFQAFYNPTDSAQSSLVLTNLIAAY